MIIIKKISSGLYCIVFIARLYFVDVGSIFVVIVMITINFCCYCYDYY